MPELPEVECLTRAVAQAVQGWKLSDATFYRADLRDAIPVDEFKNELRGKVLKNVRRRSKYMIWDIGKHSAIFHLGMSGNMLAFDEASPQLKHTHAVFKLVAPGGKDETYLHFVDPRRFGRINCLATDTLSEHAFFNELGPEPLECKNLGEHLYELSRKRKAPIKNFLMDARNVVGVGNIYASEALFRAGLKPKRAAGSVSRHQYELLSKCVKNVLSEAIKAGGTSFRDFCHPDGSDGGFEMKLSVYGRTGEACYQCGTKIKDVRLAGRSSFYCTKCQH